AAVGPERVAVRWLGLGLAWTALALTVISPSLATVVEGLPNDHYHAFADPMVFVLVGVGVAALWRASGRAVATATSAAGSAAPAATTSATAPVMTPGRLLAVVGVVAMIAWAVPHQPPVVASDGGFPAAQAAAARIQAAIPQGPIAIGSLPTFKTAEAYVYPLRRDGRQVDPVSLGGRPPVGGGPLVVVCDSLFETAIGATCGGPAEAAAVGGRSADLVDRFRAAPRQTISVYGAAPVLAAR
ncbi:MAG TPA: hypothetical protein VIU37_06545, partial [Candidatus Limnocylindrales bacterium]